MLWIASLSTNLIQQLTIYLLY